MSRKTAMMPMMSGGGSGRRVVAALVGLVLLALMLRDPVSAAQVGKQVAAWVGEVLDALETFGAALSRDS
jgi:hypothetical protein